MNTNEILRLVYHAVPFEIWMVLFCVLAMVGGLTASFTIVMIIDSFIRIMRVLLRKAFKMKTSEKGIALIKAFEGCRLQAYKAVPSEQYYTIGYGHYGSDVAQNAVISQMQAEAYLRIDLEKFEKKVEKYNPKYLWTQNEFDALVSFAYNIGSIDQLTANGTRSKQQIAAKIPAYNKAGGKPLAGLTKRRAAEQKMFVGEGGETPVISTGQMGVQTFSKAKDGSKSLSENFKVKEFACKDGSDKILIDVGFVQTHLQDIRSHFGKPVIVNSAYRTQTYNTKVGGAKSSYHMKGRAFDIAIKGVTPAEIARYAASLGINGIIQYNSFVHVDSRDTKYWARNNNGNVKTVTSF